MICVYSGISISKMANSFSSQKIRDPATIIGFSSFLGDKPFHRKAGKINVFPCPVQLAICFSFSQIFFKGRLCLE
jgi:hypothetical protein